MLSGTELAKSTAANIAMWMTLTLWQQKPVQHALTDLQMTDYHHCVLSRHAVEAAAARHVDAKKVRYLDICEDDTAGDAALARWISQAIKLPGEKM